MNHGALKAIVFAGLIATQVDIISAQARTLSANADWTWMKGANTTNQTGTYGTQGVPASANTPGARDSTVSWTDNTGALWLFGGGIYDIEGDLAGVFSDMWKYNPVTGNWTWMKGANTTNQPGIYGTPGVPDSTNTPGARNCAVLWKGLAGELWLFGGYGYDSTELGDLSDLWKYDPATGNWTWMKGANTTNQPGIYGTQGVPAPANTPGAREYAVSWTDGTGALWLFGGWGYDSKGDGGPLNDLWKFDPATTNWTWMKGSTNYFQPGIYGTQGVPAPANTPGARDSTVSWTDGTTNALWLFGGYDGHGYFNDLWKFDPATTNWTWMKGSTNFDQKGTYGTIGVPAATNTPGARGNAISWTDGTGALWLFGGYGYGYDSTELGYLSDLWKYDPATGNWTWMKCANITNQPGIYGTQGVAGPTNTPGGRGYAASWTDRKGALWLFGGWCYNHGDLNDLWKYDHNHPINDYDGDGKSDLAVYSDGYWYISSLTKGSLLRNGNWGGPGWTPMPGDYDGDGKSDLAVYRDGYWYIGSLTKGSILLNGNWGGPGWTPMPGDYDGDGKSDLAVYRDGYWYIGSLTKGSILLNGNWGGSGWTPVPGDYDGDGKADLAVYRDGYWYISSLTKGSLLLNGNWGGPGWMPVPGDYDGDGKSDLAVYGYGYWYISSLTKGSILLNGNWGGPGWTPVPGDYDGDGKSDLAVYGYGYWYISSLTKGSILLNGNWGGPGWTPVQ